MREGTVTMGTRTSEYDPSEGVGSGGRGRCVGVVGVGSLPGPEVGTGKARGERASSTGTSS